jgi:hypothetical protein
MPFNEALDFTRGSSATARTATGKIQGVLTDEQRLVGNREGFLIEEQRTNVITRSQPTVADNYWQAITDTTLSDVTLAGLPALRVTRDTGTGGLRALITNTQGNPNNVCFRTMIVRVSDPANQHLKLRVAGDSGNGYFSSDDRFHITFDLSSKTVVYTGSKAGTAEIKELSVGVFKLTLNQTHTSITAIAAAGWAFRLSDQSDAGDYNTSQVPQGSWFEFTACQREELVGPPSSYIPTAGTQVTRAADDCVRTLGDEFNPEEGTLYAEAQYLNSNTTAGGNYGLTDGTSSQRMLVAFDPSESTGGSSDFITAIITDANSVTAAIPSSVNAVASGFHKVAISYNSTSFTFAVDGVIVGTASHAGVPTVDRIDGQGETIGKNGTLTKELRLFPTALSDAELITLTGGA